MKPIHYLLALSLAWACIGPAAYAESEHEEHEEHEEHGHAEHAEQGVSRIAPAMAREIGLTLKAAAPGTVNRTLTTFGEVVTPPGQESHIRARFPGQITQVHAQIGDHVKAGDLLAEVESNESLQVYQIHAPIDGLVTERHANTGEFTQDQALFSVVDFDPLWAELRIFPSQRLAVAAGQPVALSTAELNQQSALTQLVPSGASQPYVVARVELDNRSSLWIPGLWVEGRIAVETVAVPLAVENRALQTYEGRPVVFVQQDEVFEARPLQLGRSDGEVTEVLGGLELGESYVLDNSYLIKADLEKSSAAHEH